MDISALLLKKLLTTPNLEVWSKLRLVFLDPAYSSVFIRMQNYYETYNDLPNFEALELLVRETSIATIVASIKTVEDVDVDIEIVFDALLDQYTQDFIVKKLNSFVDKLPLYSSEEAKDALSSLAFSVEEETYVQSEVYSEDSINIFKEPEDIDKEVVYLGINNDMDSQLGGILQVENLVLLGGHRGSGKSLTCSNMQVNQHNAGFASLYFTIEMTAREVFERNMAIKAGVSHKNIQTGELTETEKFSLVKARASSFIDADDLVEQYKVHKDIFKFEKDLMRSKVLKDNQMIIVDDRNLTLSEIDLEISKAKAKFREKLRVVFVDYVNQITTEKGVTEERYDWKPQIVKATKLKELARKHEVLIVSPYQIDKSGEARFAKGLLDPADLALTLHAHKDGITFETAKIRSGKGVTCTSGMNWETIAISPIPRDPPVKEDKKKKGKIKRAVGAEDPGDLPW